MSLHFRESAAGESRYAVQSEWASEGELKVRRGQYRLYAQTDVVQTSGRTKQNDSCTAYDKYALCRQDAERSALTKPLYICTDRVDAERQAGWHRRSFTASVPAELMLGQEPFYIPSRHSTHDPKLTKRRIYYVKRENTLQNLSGRK